MYSEHDLVTLNSHVPPESIWDIPDGSPLRADDGSLTGLMPGDVGTIVSLYSEDAGFMVEFVGSDGYTVALVDLAPSQVRPLADGDLENDRFWDAAQGTTTFEEGFARLATALPSTTPQILDIDNPIVTFPFPIQLGNLEGQTYTEVEAIVDTGAVTTLVPRSILESVGIVPESQETFTMEGGVRVAMDMAQVRARVGGRETITWVIFGDDDATPLLGAYTLLGAFMCVDPQNRCLIPLQPLPIQLHPTPNAPP